ncbi:hypothetical protein AB9F29_19520 [Falsihalocynthiibacter sp. S25ZX9]|uniref:hypothetical protein n=1 Tax=Falsihalocynthiibacter sp. S25ZX9 TaxID=3240870 RepID=UPI00350F24C3
MAAKFDLLGDPIPDNHGKAGRDGHVACRENHNKIRLLAIAGWTQAQIAKELGLSAPTLRKHYFLSLKKGASIAVSEIKAQVMLMLFKAAQGGNVAAMKELLKQAERSELEALAGKARGDGKAKEKPLGKKAQQSKDARDITLNAEGGVAAHLPSYSDFKH